jgi:uncharacterized protein (DUF486 family)
MFLIFYCILTNIQNLGYFAQEPNYKEYIPFTQFKMFMYQWKFDTCIRFQFASFGRAISAYFLSVPADHPVYILLYTIQTQKLEQIELKLFSPYNKWQLYLTHSINNNSYKHPNTHTSVATSKSGHVILRQMKDCTISSHTSHEIHWK